MHSRFTSTALALLIGVACAGAHAQSKTREQVRQELVDAVRAGTLMRGEVDARDALPGATLYGRTRAEVRAEFDAAQRSGELQAAGEAIQKVGEASRQQLAGKTRSEVLAELADAQRNGELLVAGELGLTQRDLHPRAPASMAAGKRGDSAMVSSRTMH